MATIRAMTGNVLISKRLVLINSTSAVLAKVLNVAVLVWLQQYLLRRIDPDEFALYPVIVGLMIFLPLLTTVLTGGYARYIVEAYTKDDLREVTRIVSTMVPLLAVAALLLLIVGGTCAWHIDSLLTIKPARVWDARIMMGLLVIMAAIRLPAGPFTVGLYVRQKFVLANVIRLVREMLRIALLFALLFGVSTRVLWVVVATVSASLCELTVLLSVSRRMIPSLRFRRSEIRRSTANKLMSFGGWNFVAQLANTIRTSADVIILNKLATAIDVNSFHVGSLALGQIQQSSWTVSAPLQPALTAMHATGSKRGLRSAYLRGGRYALWASLFMVIPLVVYRHEVLRLYLRERYDDYSSAATVMMLLLALFPVVYGNVMLPKISHATARMRPLAMRTIFMQSLNLALTFYFVGARRMGAVGSALATFLVVTFLYPVLNWPLGWRLAGVNWREWLRETVWPGFAPGIGAAFVWTGLQRMSPPQTWLMLGAYAAAGCVCYVMILLAFCLQPVDRQDFATAWAKFRSFVGRSRR